MAFTNIGDPKDPNVRIGEGTGGSYEPYFHPGDIATVANQPGAVSVMMTRAVVGRGANQRECFVLIGITQNNHFEPPSGGEAKIPPDVQMAAAEHLVALPCPPFNHDDGLFMPEPIPDPNFP